MMEKLTMTTERVDDIPVLLAQSEKMGIAELLNACAGYLAHPFVKWMVLLFISAVSRSCGIHR
jgi:hypothetical protein